MARSKSRGLLVLVPTQREAEFLFGRRRAPAASEIALVGIGLAEAGAAASRLLVEHAPRAALLVGIAGTLDPARVPVGAVVVATRVGCDGLGAGEGRTFVSFAGRSIPLRPFGPAGRRIVPEGTKSQGAVRAISGEILSVAAAAGSRAMVRSRRLRHPRAVAEEMEGYSVAVAARSVRVPLTIVRGISNLAGDRDQRRWRWREGLAACRAAIDEWLSN